MHRRALSIALYFCATALSILFVAQLSGGFFPALQVQYWPVALAGMYAVSAFLLPEADVDGVPQSRFALRCMGLILFFLSPFLSWSAMLSSFGVGYVPIGRHIYMQVAGIVDLFSLLFLLCLYGGALLKSFGVELRFLGRKMLQAPFWFVLIPAFAVLAGVFLLCFAEGEGENYFPGRMIPNVLWTILFRDLGADICAGLFGLSLALHALGVNCVICAKRPKKVSEPVAEEVPPELTEFLTTILEGKDPSEILGKSDDKADKID